MKKIVITIAAVVFAAVAVQAQSPSVEVRGTDACLGGYWSKKPTGASARKVKANQNKQTAQYAQLQNKVANQVQRATAADAQKKAAAKQQTAKTTTNSATKKTGGKVKIAKRNGTVGQWIKAVVLGGRYPGETAEAYHSRLLAQSQPAALPFK